MPNTPSTTPRDKREAANKRANAAENAGRQAENSFNNLQTLKEAQEIKKQQPGFKPKPLPPPMPRPGGGWQPGPNTAKPEIIGLAGTTISARRGWGSNICLRATNNPTTFSAQGLPNTMRLSLAFDKRSAALCGTITETVPGKFVVTVTAANNIGIGTATFTINVV